MSPGAGPGLTYITLPAVFASMPGGGIFAVIFFLLLLTAALTSSVSIIEPLAAYLIDQFGIRRVRASLLVALVTTLVGIPCAWSFGGGDMPEIFGRNPFDFMDFITSDALLPLNVMASCVLMGWFVSKAFTRELCVGREGSDQKEGIVRAVVFSCRYVAPAAILGVFGYKYLPMLFPSLPELVTSLSELLIGSVSFLFG
jgi:NSS family neurotransmitter:Na+ symporter